MESLEPPKITQFNDIKTHFLLMKLCIINVPSPNITTEMV